MLARFISRKPPELKRAEYKAVWNAQSKTEDAAKIAVSGHLDDAVHDSTARGATATVTRYVGLSDQDIVLEIGAGFGRVGSAMAPLCKKWIGTDVSENMVQVMKRRLGHLPNVEAIVTNGYDLSNIASESVTLVYCTVVFMHLDEWDRYKYTQEAFRILKPGGRFLADNINICSNEGWQIFIDHTKIPPLARPPHISRSSTPQEMKTYFVRVGFQKIGQAEQGPWIITYGTKF